MLPIDHPRAMAAERMIIDTGGKMPCDCLEDGIAHLGIEARAMGTSTGLSLFGCSRTPSRTTTTAGGCLCQSPIGARSYLAIVTARLRLAM